MHVVTKLALTCILALSLTACVTTEGMPGDTGKAGQNTPAVTDGKATPPPVIPEFGDIPIPRELTRQDDQSFIYEAPGTVIGVMVYTGNRVDADSIHGFFREQMPTHGWRFINAYRDQNIDLIFMKDNRSCQISIKSGMIETKVIIKVGPSSSGPAS